ncbi:hypothetical protein EV643_1569 [Kribbella sp. VKM Ac-2527]|uniref:Lipoprotein n=1 Tax=Kribbella caucasensis TaxID=2512215 RepID=A0A4R6J090_9ACTN|nr:hypothetical protein [Kribbella sp. VKM Ac-2527]TDO27525.1 hypothetical protein EV643_1569 [Kribbella sp. VKM Ac-2527]
MRQTWIAPVLVVIGLVGCAAEKPVDQAAGEPTASATAPAVTEQPSSEPTESTPSTIDPKRGLAPGGDQQKVYGTESITVTNPDGYKAKVDVIVYEPHQVDISYGRAAAGCDREPPSALRSSKAVVYAARVEGQAKDLKPNGFAWDFDVAYLGIYNSLVGKVGDDIGRGWLWPAGCDMPASGKLGESHWYIPFSADAPVGKFAWDVVVWKVPTPNAPKVDRAEMRHAALVLAGIEFRGGWECTAKMSKGMSEAFPGCKYGPDLGDRF